MRGEGGGGEDKRKRGEGREVVTHCVIQARA